MSETTKKETVHPIRKVEPNVKKVDPAKKIPEVDEWENEGGSPFRYGF